MENDTNKIVGKFLVGTVAVISTIAAPVLLVGWLGLGIYLIVKKK